MLNGAVKKLHDSLTEVLGMWWDEMIRLGVMPTKPTPVKPNSSIPKREQQGESAKLAISIKRGERFKQVIQLKKFNYQTLKAELIELDGINPKMEIRESPEHFSKNQPKGTDNILRWF